MNKAQPTEAVELVHLRSSGRWCARRLRVCFTTKAESRKNGRCCRPGWTDSALEYGERRVCSDLDIPSGRVREGTSEVVHACGAVDILVNNAGILSKQQARGDRSGRVRE